MGSRRSVATRARFPASEPVETHWETYDTATKTVPGLASWVNRDPIEEEGGENLQAFAQNLAISQVDSLGLEIYGEHLTSRQAQQLQCAISFFLVDASVYNAIRLWGSEDRSRTIEFLRRFINKEGGIVTMPYSEISSQEVIARKNADARTVLVLSLIHI